MFPRLVVPALAAVLFASPLFAQVSERIDVSAIEVPVVVRDAKGNVPPDLTASDFVLLEDGKPQQIIGVSYPVRRIAAPAVSGTAPAPTPTAPPLPAEKRWQVVIYIQQSLSSTHGLSEALKSLAPHADELTALGDVSIVGDEGPTPHVIAPATNNGATLRNTLLDLVPKIRGLEEVTRLRMQYLSEPGAMTRSARPSMSNRSPDSSSIRALVTARLEAQIVRLRQEAMLTWTARFQEPGRQHALLVITSGYDLNPYDFYGSSDPSTDQELRALSAAPRQAEIAQALTANGWTILSFAPEWMETAFSPTFDVTNSGRGRLNDFKRGVNEVATPIALNVHPLDALRTLAEESGGSVQTSSVNLTKDLDQLANRLVLTYQLHRPRDGRAHRIEVRSLRAGLSARVQRSVVAGTPEALAVARASLLASDEGERGELPVRCTVRELAAPKKGKDLTSQLEALVSLAPIDPVRPGLTAATLRFSVAVNTAGAPPVTISKRMENLDLSKQANWRIDFQVQHSPGATIGIVAEEMATGAWGGTRCAAEGATAPAAAPAATDRDLSLPLSGRWKTLAAATAEAQAKGTLILLDSRGATTDTQGDQWIASLEALPAASRVLDGMVLAASGGGTQAPADAGALRGRRHLTVLDPWGGTILEPDEGFRDPAKFAFALNALAQQAPTFVRSAKARQEGKVAQSQLRLAGGLLDAGAAENAGELFRQAYTAAKQQNDTETMQRAQLGIAALDAQAAEKAPKAVHDLEEITAHPANSEIASSAWMLLGHIHRGRIGETKQAIAAYQKSFAAAPKPSPLAEAARRHLETLGSEPESEVRAGVAAGNVHLLYPHREVMVGNVDFGVATPGEASRVEVFLDDARVAELTRPPFRTRVSLGTAPHVRTVRAVAYDAQERRLGEESVILNDRPVSLGVNIVAPASDSVASRTVVEVKPRLPQGSHLAGIDLFWNETKIATLTAPPFRHELVLPSPSATGFIRAVARADDGTSAEDVKMINAGGVAEQMRVDAVQVYAIVQDRHGHYVDGLTASDFVVKEDGRTVTARVQSGKDDPISIGIALDTSSSMQVAMSEVIDFANEFVSHSLGAADQTFVTAFDEEPRLVQPLTNNRKEVTASIYGVHANGGTAIWDALLYSLQQFHGVPGKRALVVFTDAVNNAGSATPKGVLQYAREVGVPVYVVQIFTGARPPSAVLVNPRRNGLGGFPVSQMTSDERNIENLTESTGGAFFRFVGKKDLPHIFSQIRDDTRGQYLLTYVSPSTKPRAELRRITVEVPGKSVVVRATSGYYPR